MIRNISLPNYRRMKREQSGVRQRLKGLKCEFWTQCVYIYSMNLYTTRDVPWKTRWVRPLANKELIWGSDRFASCLIRTDETSYLELAIEGIHQSQSQFVKKRYIYMRGAFYLFVLFFWLLLGHIWVFSCLCQMHQFSEPLGCVCPHV